MLFDTGRLLITTNARDTLNAADVLASLGRHIAGDWGDLCDEDKQSNQQALTKGTRLLSAYHDSKGCKFWIITEADRSSTTILLPEDY